MATRQPATRAPTTSNSNVRRNLFHHHLSRRPTSTSTSTSTTTLQESSRNASSSDIVMRDQNGNYQVQMPSLPAMDDDQTPEQEGTEADKLEARLFEMYRNRTRQATEPTELLEAVRSSLRRKVASLEDDNWIYEGETGTST